MKEGAASPGAAETKEKSQSFQNMETERRGLMELGPRSLRDELLGWCWCLRGMRIWLRGSGTHASENMTKLVPGVLKTTWKVEPVDAGTFCS